MKKIFVFVCVLFMIFLGACGSSKPIKNYSKLPENSGDVKGNENYWELTSDGTMYIRCNGDMPDYTWTSGSRRGHTPWADDIEKIKKIIVEDSVTHIGNFSFYGAKNVEYVKLSSDLKTIGTYAFADCRKLEKISLPHKLEEIGDTAFGYCGFSEIVFPESLEIIRESAFDQCDLLEKVTMPQNIKIIEGYAFYNLQFEIIYAGTQTEWSKISIGERNGCLNNVTW